MILSIDLHLGGGCIWTRDTDGQRGLDLCEALGVRHQRVPRGGRGAAVPRTECHFESSTFESYALGQRSSSSHPGEGEEILRPFGQVKTSREG